MLLEAGFWTITVSVFGASNSRVEVWLDFLLVLAHHFESAQLLVCHTIELYWPYTSGALGSAYLPSSLFFTFFISLHICPSASLFLSLNLLSSVLHLFF